MSFLNLIKRIFFPSKSDNNLFLYVYVEDDGSVRELYDDEKDYLKSDFDYADSGRPYIKSKYSQLTPDQRISGFIKRSKVPKEISIKLSK